MVLTMLPPDVVVSRAHDMAEEDLCICRNWSVCSCVQGSQSQTRCSKAWTEKTEGSLHGAQKSYMQDRDGVCVKLPNCKHEHMMSTVQMQTHMYMQNRAVFA